MKKQAPDALESPSHEKTHVHERPSHLGHGYRPHPRRSRIRRAAYLDRLEQAKSAGPVRDHLSCTNLAHALAAFGPHDKCVLREGRLPNIGIVSAYNDMLSAHQPLERFPAIIKQAAREAGGVAQFAGGVPAMCDGVTQGHGVITVQP
jgi:phosphogluconate dehydratase